MRSGNCPDKSAWQQFMLGQIRDPEASAFEKHLDTCLDCGSALATFDVEDDLVEALRTPSSILSDATLEISGITLMIPSAARRERATEAASDDGPQEIAGYRVVRTLGRGGSSVVYLAVDPRLGRSVALKVLLETHLPNPQYLARFEREAQILARLEHPGIVRIYEVGTYRGRPYLALEYIGGESLAAQLSGQPLPVVFAARLLCELAHAVQYAHEHGIIHRDLKPANILLAISEQRSAFSQSDETLKPDNHTLQAVPKITDFGLGRQLSEESLTHTGDVLGTPAYMAPEQIGGKTAQSTAAADLYSLGAMLYELLTGRPPFRGGTVLETLDQVRMAEPVPLRRLRPGLPLEIETICLKCLEKEPARRYKSAAALAEDLERFLDHRPILARPTGLFTQGIKWAKRRPTLAGLTSLLIVALVALLVGGVLYERQLRQALNLARSESERADEQAQSAERSAFRADANYRKARTALQKMLTRTRDPRWNTVPRLQQLRREQIEDALAFFESLSAQQSTDVQVRQDIAWACLEAGKLQVFLGRTEQGLRNIRRAVDNASVLLSTEPNSVTLRLLRAEALVSLGVLTATSESVRSIEQGVTELEFLLPGELHASDIRTALAAACINLGGAYENTQDHAKAQQVLIRGIELYDQLLRETPDDRPRIAQRARARINLSAAYRQSKQQAQARVQHDLAERDLESLYTMDSLDRDTIDGLAVLRINGAYDLGAMNKQDEAAAYVQRNVPMLEQALKREPDDRVYRDRLFRTWGVTAMMLRGQKRAREAALAWDKVLTYVAEEERQQRLFEGIDFWLEARDHVRAAALAEQVKQCLEQKPQAKSWKELAELLDRIAVLVADDAALPSQERQLLVERHRASAQHARQQAQTPKPPTK